MRIHRGDEPSSRSVFSAITSLSEASRRRAKFHGAAEEASNGQSAGGGINLLVEAVEWRTGDEREEGGSDDDDDDAPHVPAPDALEDCLSDISSDDGEMRRTQRPTAGRNSTLSRTEGYGIVEEEEEDDDDDDEEAPGPAAADDEESYDGTSDPSEDVAPDAAARAGTKPHRDPPLRASPRTLRGPPPRRRRNIPLGLRVRNVRDAAASSPRACAGRRGSRRRGADPIPRGPPRPAPRSSRRRRGNRPRRRRSPATVRPRRRRGPAAATANRRRGSTVRAPSSAGSWFQERFQRWPCNPSGTRTSHHEAWRSGHASRR